MILWNANTFTRVSVKLDVYPGLPHAFGYFPELPSAIAVQNDLIVAMREMIAAEF